MSALTRAISRSAAEPLCRLAGIAWYLAAPAARAAVRDNLCHILGREPSRRQIVRVFQYGALNYWDTFAIPHVSHSEVLRLVDFSGAEHLAAAHARGKGAIVATGHLGSVAFVGQIVPALGYPIVGLMEPLPSRELFEFFARQREGRGARLLPSGRAGLRELLAALRRNEVLGLVTDRDVTGTGPRVRFFDAETQFPDGAAALAMRTGAALLTGACVRKRGGRFEAWVEPLPEVSLTGDTRQDVLAITQAIAGRLEYYVANHPEQWTVFQRRWPQARPG